jgi:F-type H+-transporting ATPase subunit b
MMPDVPLILTHIVGFIITIWILKKFAWKPLLGIMEERRQKIKAEFDKIEDDRAEVARVRADYETRLKDIDVLARQKMTEAINEGHRIAAEIKEKGRQESKDIIDRAKAELVHEAEKARVALKEDMVRITMTAAEKIITKRLDEKEDRRLIAEFIEGVEKA